MLRSLCVLALCSFLALTAACSDDEPTSPTGTTDPSMKAKVDGSAWTATSVTATKLGAGMTVITGLAADGSVVKFELNGVSQTGTYDVTKTSTDINAAYINGSMEYWVPGQAASGTMAITQFDATHVAGTFSFTGTRFQNSSEKAVVTDGAFYAKF
jgi:hypothetical protein